MESAQYQVDDKSVLHAFYQRVVFDRLTPRIPASVSPNTLTGIGHVLGVLAAVFCVIAAKGHPAFYVASALSILASQTFDQIDGAHARRTGQTSRRGELLDHGLDGIRSTAVIIMAGVLLHMSDVAMAIFAALATVTFASVFWEQFRTGRLSLPKVGPDEAVTALALWEVMVALFGEPTWLQFSPHELTAGTVLVGVVVLAHAVAVLPPFLRASKRGVSPMEVAPLVAVVALQLAFLLHGADVIVVVSTMGLCCSHATCHFIVVRLQGARGPVLPPTLFLVALPIGALVVAPSVAEVAAVVALILAVAGYAHTAVRGWRLLA